MANSKIHFETPKQKGYHEHDESGNMIHYKDNVGNEFWIGYNNLGYANYFKDISGYEFWIDYDESGNKIQYRDSNGRTQDMENAYSY